VITIFGSCFSFMIGLAQIPYTAAKDGYFYVFLAHEHETMHGLSDYSLLFVGGLSTVFCFLELEIVIEGMLTMQLLIQFMSQGFGLMYYRFLVHEDDQETPGFKTPMFPAPCLIQLVIFGFIFCTTDTYVFHGHTPLLEVAMAFIASGVGCYLLWARKNGFWPYENQKLDSDDEGLDHMVVYVADEKFGKNDFGNLKSLLARKEDELDRLMKSESETAVNKSSRAADLENTEKALKKKAYRIEQLYKKLELQNAKLAELLEDLNEKEREVTDEKMTNAELKRTLNRLQVKHGLDQHSSSDYELDGSEDEGVLGWGVNEVVEWWKEMLPKGAQEFIPVVEECHLVGKDLIELDKEMLEQLGIKKLLVMKILKQIEPLRREANLPPRTDLDEYSDRGPSKSAERGRRSHRSSRNYGGNEEENWQQGTMRRSRSRGATDHEPSDHTTGHTWGWEGENTNQKGDRVGITSV